tara:strand:+ start:6984 stop:7928 length:945 start_codon:yes stop_codon:yes gene_type:complete
MENTHTFEFWSYLNYLSPEEIFLQDLPGSSSLEESELEVKIKGSDVSLGERVLQDWGNAMEVNPQMTNKKTSILRTISPDGREIKRCDSDYMSAFWIKKNLPEVDVSQQREFIRNKFSPLGLGVVTITSDGYVLIEKRPPNVAAPGMLLAYPCGGIDERQENLVGAVNSEFRGELGFEAFDDENRLNDNIGNIYSLGIIRESAENIPLYTFFASINKPSTEIKSTKEIKQVFLFPANPRKLVDELPRLYSPRVTGEGIEGMCVPNTLAMIGLYVKDKGGERLFGEYMDRISQTAETQGIEIDTIEHTPRTNPFQ